MKYLAGLACALLFCLSAEVSAQEYGEVNFIVNNISSGQSVTISIVQTSTYSWSQDPNTKQVIYSPPYSHSNTITYDSQSKRTSFDSPTSPGGSSEGVLPWGQMQITINTGGSQVSKTIDFSDENWTSNSTLYPSDYYVNIYMDTYSVTQTVKGSTTDFTSTPDNIWNIFGPPDGYNPAQADLLPPVFLKNLINTTDAGGKLQINGTDYNSGDVPLRAYEQSYTIGTRAKADGVNIDRFPDYQGSGVTYKQHDWNSSNTDYLLSRQVTIHTSNNHQTANFSPLNSATLQNSLDGTVYTGSNGGIIPFVDPWYVDSNGNQTGQAVDITSGSSPTGAYGQSIGGVFLGQTYGGSSPHYSLQALVSQTINGHSGYFGSWSASPGGYVTFQDATNPTTAVVFNQSGATVTSNYIYSVVATNSTWGAGTYNLATNITINSGVTLTLQSGANVNFNGYYIDATNGTLSIQNGSTVYLTDGGSRYYGLFTSVQSAINAASSGQTVTITSSYTLTGNMTLPSGVSLTTSGLAAIILNGYYVVATGGGTVSGAVDGFAATISGANGGCFPTIQSAIDHASSGQTVLAPPITRSESPSITSKSGVTLQGAGQGSTTVQNISITGSSNISVSGFTLGAFSLNNNSSTSISNVTATSTSLANDYGGTYDELAYCTASNIGASFGVTGSGSSGTVTRCSISNGDCGVYLTNNASWDVRTGNQFCCNGYDIDATSGASAYAADNSSYSHSFLSSILGNVSYDPDEVNAPVCSSPCGGLSMKGTGGTLAKQQTAPMPELDAQYLALMRRIFDDRAAGKYDSANYAQDYVQLIGG